jgi:protein involved in polysaccharide export with SLBB domain
VIDIKQMAFGGTQRYLSLSLRPGDVIMVPSGGQVLVEGWVQRPGAYSLTPGLTLAGVIAQAGGQMFPADITALRVIRADKLAMKTFIFADLQKIKTGEAADVALQGGDIVQVSAEQSKLIAYGIYRFFSTVINVGVGGTVPIVR